MTELLQNDVTPEKISTEVEKILENRAQIIEKLKIACDKLGKPGAASRVAQKILETAGDKL